MKKLRQLVLMAFLSMITLSMFGQASDLFFSEYAEGSSNNKYLEIYNGTGAAVDLTPYVVQLASNGGAWGTYTLDLSGILADGDVYVIANSAASATILAEADITSTVTYYNGDDAVGLFKDGTPIDIIGVQGEDPGNYWPVAGVSDGTKEHTLVRKPNVCSPTTDWAFSAGTNTDDSQWIVFPQDNWDNLGFHTSDCAGGQTVALPTFSPEGGTFTSPVNVEITCSTPASTIYYTTDGTDPSQGSTVYSTPIYVSEATTIKAKAYADDYNPSFIASATYNFPATVSTLAELRAGTLGNTYLVTGEVWLTFQQDFRGNKYFQDETAGILIDDNAGVITSDFEIGDGVTGLSGVLGEFGGMLQLVPDSDPGDPISSGNFPTPQVISVDELFSNFEEYESELVQLNAVTFTDGGGVFTNGTVYSFEEISNTIGNFRTTFYDVDYIGTAIPDIPVGIVGLPNSRADGEYITSRSLNDFILGTLVATPTFNPEGGDITEPIEVEISCATAGASIYFTTDGSDPDETSTLYTTPISISETTVLKAKAYLDGIDPSLIATAQYNFAATLANLAELRDGVIGSTYTIAGEVWLTYQQANRNQKFIQDATAAVLIDDVGGKITTPYNIGDGITGISGVLGEYGGMIQFVPDADPGLATSSGNFPEPQVVTIAELFGNFDAYESELVKIMAANFADAGATFATGTAYAISDDSDAIGNFRTSFYDADYIGTTIFTVPTDIVGIPNSRTDGEYVTARSLADFTPELVPPEIRVLTPNGGEAWQQGNTYTISWLNINFTKNVKISITKPPFTVIVLAANVANTGTWSWTIPGDFALANNYKIRVAGVDAGDPLDLSDDFFSVIEPLPDPDIVINEIMYNPASSLGNDADFEYLELYNNSGFDVDLSGWTIAQAVTYTFDEGTVLSDDAYLVVALKPDSIIAHYNITNVVGPFSGGLNNTGETIEILDADGIQMDMVTYADGGDWPSEPDGSGPSLELMDPNFDNSLPESWAASLVNDGTPGMQNSVFGAELLTLTAPNGGETFEQGSSQEVTWIYSGFEGELMVKLIDVQLDDTVTLATNVAVEPGVWAWEVPGDLAPGDNYKIMIAEMTDGEPMDESDYVFSVVELIIPAITVVSPNGGEDWAQGTAHDITWTYDFFAGDVKIELSDGIDAVTLIAESIPVSNASFTWDIPVDLLPGDAYSIIISGMETGDPSDESDGAFSITAPQPFPELVINEIMYNSPESGTDTLEFIEIYNKGAFSVNLQNWSFGQGVTMVFPDYELAAGDYVVTAYSAEVMLNAFGVVALEWTGGGLSNGGETIELSNDSNEQVDIVSYDDGGAWNSAPDGYGPSLALIDPTLDNDLAENWNAETVFAFDHDAGIPVFASPGAINFSTPGQGILVSSGWQGISSFTNLANPSVESAMSMLVNDLVVMQDFSNLYFPLYGINTIGDWNMDKGYQLKLDNKRYTVLYGEMATDRTVSLVEGWNGMPVLSECAVEAATLFAGLAELIFVKEMGSNLVYFPQGGLFSLEYLEPGKAYFIKMSAAADITYPECIAIRKVQHTEFQFENNTNWNDVSPTSASHAIGIDALAMKQFKAGDVIGAFTQDGFCAGMVEVSSQNAMLMAWADDIYTQQIDGFTDGEVLNYKLYSRAEVMDLIPTYNLDYPDAGGFVSHGISFISHFKTTTTGIFETSGPGVDIYPNPAGEVLNLELNRSGYNHFEVFSAIGQKMIEGGIYDQHQVINIQNLENGFYFIKFVNSMNGNQESINFIKNQ